MGRAEVPLSSGQRQGDGEMWTCRSARPIGTRAAAVLFRGDIAGDGDGDGTPVDAPDAWVENERPWLRGLRRFARSSRHEHSGTGAP